MKKLLSIAKSFQVDDNGAAMVEYSILIGIITAAVITMIVAVGIYVGGAWGKLCSNLQAHESTVGVTMNCT
jgi:pilus assembly protein Flp/PilA